MTLAEAASVLATLPAPDGVHANAHVLGSLRAHAAFALALPWPVLETHPGIDSGFDALLSGVPWAVASASHV